MSKYTSYYTAKQNHYRNFATNWARFTADLNLTERQRRGMSLFFKPIARRFGLIQEFRDIGVI